MTMSFGSKVISLPPNPRSLYMEQWPKPHQFPPFRSSLRSICPPATISTKVGLFFVKPWSGFRKNVLTLPSRITKTRQQAAPQLFESSQSLSGFFEEFSSSIVISAEGSIVTLLIARELKEPPLVAICSSFGLILSLLFEFCLATVQAIMRAAITPSNIVLMCAPPSKIDGKYLAPVDDFALATHINDNQSKSECYTVWKPNGLVIAVVFVIVEIIGKSR